MWFLRGTIPRFHFSSTPHRVFFFVEDVFNIFFTKLNYAIMSAGAPSLPRREMRYIVMDGNSAGAALARFLISLSVP